MREDIIGPRYAIRLGDLKSWHVLRVTCLQCSHVATVSPAPLLRRFGEYRRLAELEKRFACKACGNRSGNSARVFRLDRNAAGDKGGGR
jgi:hypothetical protein